MTKMASPAAMLISALAITIFSTARFYTDISLLTSDPEITRKAPTTSSATSPRTPESDDYKPLLVSPLTLAETFIRMIHRETEHATAGRHPAQIIAKMNALLEPSVIEALYAASKAGVADRPGPSVECVPCALASKALSENIHVRSIVGRFLEHSRIFYFQNGGEEEMYCGSADWLARNLFERCEVVFPIKDPLLRARLRDEILGACLADNVKARLEAPDGSYYYANSVEPYKSQPPFNSQEFLMRLADGQVTVNEIPKPVFAAPPKPPPRARSVRTKPVRRVPKAPAVVQTESPEPMPEAVQA